MRRFLLVFLKEERLVFLQQLVTVFVFVVGGGGGCGSNFQLQYFLFVAVSVVRIKIQIFLYSGEVVVVVFVRVGFSFLEGDRVLGQGYGEGFFVKSSGRFFDVVFYVSRGFEDFGRGSGLKSISAFLELGGDQQTVWYEYGCV